MHTGISVSAMYTGLQPVIILPIYFYWSSKYKLYCYTNIFLQLIHYFSFQLDRKIVAIPRSTNEGRIRQNIDILDFALTPEEISELSQFNSNYRLRTPAKWYPHPHFPFEKKNLTEGQIQYIIEHSKED